MQGPPQSARWKIRVELKCGCIGENHSEETNTGGDKNCSQDNAPEKKRDRCFQVAEIHRVVICYGNRASRGSYKQRAATLSWETNCYAVRC